MTGDLLPPSIEFETRLQTIRDQYPDYRSAVMPALYLAQEHYGHISEAAIQWVAKQLDIPPVHVMEVATFYTMYYKKAVGKYHVQVCRTLPCMLRGARTLTEELKKRLGLKAGEVSADGLWSYEEVECLGSCGSAPMCEINDVYFENLTPEKLNDIMNKIQRDKLNLRLSTSKDSFDEAKGSEPRYSSNEQTIQGK